MPLLVSCIITVFLSISSFYFVNHKRFNKIKIVYKQILIGISFGLCSIYATQFGSIEIEGAALNARDAAPICAGLLFGPLPSIISCLIGGVYRYFAAFWGVGVYTQYACSFATISAGFLTALCSVTLFKKNYPTTLHAFVIVLLIEVLHVSMVPLFNFDDIQQSILVAITNVVPLLLSNAFAVVTSMLSIWFLRFRAKKGSLRHFSFKNSVFVTKDLFFTFQFWLLLLIVSSFFINIVVTLSIYKEYSIQDIEKFSEGELTSLNSIAINESEQNYLEEAIKIVNQWNIKAENDASNNNMYYIFDENNNILNNNNTFENISSYIDQIPENSLTKLRMYYNTEQKEISVYVYLKNFGSYKAVICSLEKEVMFFSNLSIAITSGVQIIVFSLLMFAVFLLLKKLIGVNIDRINYKLNEIIKGNLNQEIDVYAYKEFTQLSENINATVDNLKNYISKEANRYKKDFELAHQIQLSVLPRNFPAFPNRKDFDIYAIYKSAKEIGGDFYDYYLINDNTLFVLIADVSGKGIPAALFMMRSKTAIRSYITQKNDPGIVFSTINNYLCENNEADMFVTAWAGIVDLQTGTIKYSNAGHNPPIILKQNNQNHYVKGKVNFVLGAIPDIKYDTQVLQLNKNESLFLYTDGITEANNDSYNLYGEGRLLALTESLNLNPKEICTSVLNSVDSFTQGHEQFDDMTIFALSLYDLKENGYSKSKKVVNKWEYSVESSIKNIEQLLGFTEEILEKENIDIKTQYKVNVVIDEIFSNIVNYGYKDKKGFITLNLQIKYNNKLSKKYLQLKFIDSSPYFNPLKHAIPDTHASVEDRKIGGLGIHMTRKLMDNVFYEYKNNSNCLILVKYIE